MVGVFARDIRYALRSLASARGLTLIVVLTLALGIGANAAIFTLVRGVLLRPLVNRDEDRLIYVRQSAEGLGMANALFSVPEMQDLRQRVKLFRAIGDFSEIGFTMIGLGEPRELRAGVVGGNYFEVMGLHPVLGRLLDMRDDGPTAAGAVVLTYQFWKKALKSDPSVLGKVVRLESFGPPRTGTVVGVLEPSIPYPTETEIIANVVTSPHHLSATMVTGRIHRMTELFGRLAPGATLEQVRAELSTAHGAMMKEHPDAYPVNDRYRIAAAPLRDEITSKARTVLWVLLAASGLVFVIACSNVANLILARTIRREGEFVVRTALGAGTAALRRVLLAECLLLCGAGAALGVLSARPMVAILARYASRFSVRALDLTVDSSMLWVGAGLALAAAVLLAFVPRLPSGDRHGISLATGSVRVTGGASGRLRAFAVTQIAASFVLLAGAAMLVKTLLALQAVDTGIDTRRVLAINVPVLTYGRTPDQVVDFYKEAIRRVHELPGVDAAAIGILTPWREGGAFGPGLQFTAEGYHRGTREDDPRGQFRIVSPGFFASLGVPILAGRDFNDLDRQGSEPVAIISQTVARRMFPDREVLNRHVTYTDPLLQFTGGKPTPMRVVGVAADIDDEHLVPAPTMTLYTPFGQGPLVAGRLFVHVRTDPYALINPITRTIRNLSVDQPVERAATLEDVRAEVLTPDRLNAMVFGGFAMVALTIAVVGVAGVLAFSVSARTREFGIRLAVGSQPRRLLARVIAEGTVITAAGIGAGLAGGFGLERLAGTYFESVKMPGAWVVAGAAGILLAAAVIASAWPAMRAARVDVIQALRAD
ncbi:MAG: ABC transporter permease [Acidobacteriota bacterium]|nr:ABC transporter permease [Acidobacteriota bacterium]